MATGDTAPPPLSIPPPQIEPLSDDDGSSPLSDVEDKDDEPDELHIPSPPMGDVHNEGGSSDDILSEANDTEAETERLYDTPQQASRHKDVVLAQGAEGKVYERTPSKLRHGETTAERDGGSQNKTASDDDVSMASSPPAQATQTTEKPLSPTLDILAEAANQEAESRKRKRSPQVAEPPEAEQPHRKRTGSAAAPDRSDRDGDTAMVYEEDPTTHTLSGEHSADEGAAAPAGDEGDVSAQAAPSEQDTATKKQTRSSSRKLRGAETVVESEEPAEATADTAGLEEDGAHTGEEEQMDAGVDEEAEAAHRNEEELERKRAAFEQLMELEKRFATFRERFYEERLEQLTKEEAMLRANKPTHPEYLAMMECIDARRDERIRVADRELELHTECQDRAAVARRSQIHSQFFQAVRESRERILAELGQHWYKIQHERRKNANNVPEFGIRFPQSPHQRVRDALAYNKEVSILSGVARYEGMPAAPEMKGASSQEMDDDFDAIIRGRHQASRQPIPRPAYADYGGVPFGEALGPAGEQFLEQTPWANPNHPSNAHLLQRQHSMHQEPQGNQAGPSGASPNPKRQSHQPNPFTISSGTQPYNGNAKPRKSTPRQASASPELTRAASLLEQTKARSMKAAAAEAAKRENGQSLGGYS
ncbi:Sds3-like-domain-containing protein [Xylariomycetidae sp. FL0641]|nr:Sds3-like-domain-containing protein [Xylariomycetidae sp. FL0641]